MLARPRGPDRLGCANLAHATAALPRADKLSIVAARAPNIGVVTAYNDMLSAHQPYERFPPIIREAAHALGATAQVAGGVPAMCDGVTQGLPGHGDEPVLARHDRDGDGDRALARRLRRRAAARHLRQDRSGPAHRRAPLRPPAVRLRSRRADGKRPGQRREDARARAVRARPRRSRRAHGSRGGVVSQPRHVHLLRHRQQQPDAARGDGPARARRRLHPSARRPARCADARRRSDSSSPTRRGRRRQRAARRASCRSAGSSTSARSSTRWSRCSPPAARPTT